MKAVNGAIGLFLGAILPVLSACSAGGPAPAAQPEAATSALPPKYLAVDQFQSCLQSKQVETYRQWCMPASKPASCAAQSWDELDGLQGKEKVPGC